MATKQAVNGEGGAAEPDVDTNLLDTQSAAMKRLIARGKERGYITFDELNAVLPQDQNSSEQIEDVMSMLSETGIQVVEGEESEDAEAAPTAEALRPQARIVADAVDRAEDDVAAAKQSVEAARLLGETAVVVQEFAAEPFYQRAQMRDGGAAAADVDDAPPAEVD